MNTAVRPVTFANRDGHRLFGILHEPASPRRDLAVILLSPGIKSRVAPHRMYCELAEAFLAQGFTVLRFDFHGLGDSEGSVENCRLADFYGSVQLGRYAADAAAAIDWTIARCQVPRVIVGGLCGGALTGLFSGAGDARVAGLFGFGVPVVLDGSNIDGTRYMSVGQLRGLRVRYLHKLLDVPSWIRLLTLRTDFRLLLRALCVRREAAGPPSLADPEAVRGNVNPHFRPAFTRMLADGRPILLLFAGSDRLYWEFTEKYANVFPQEIARFRDVLDVQVIADANHVFTFRKWQEQMIRVTCQWVGRRFPGAGAPEHRGVRMPAAGAAHS